MNKEKKTIKRYKVVIDPDDSQEGFMDRISIVDKPAIEITGHYFSQNIYKFKADKEKMEIIAPFLIPDLFIDRFDPETKEYYQVVFEKDAIVYLVEKFMKSGDNRRINYNHEDIMVNGYIKELWIKESENDKSSDYGFGDTPIGTAFMKVKIEDKDFWDNEVKQLGFYSYSIELIADLQEIDFAVISSSVDSANVKSYRYSIDNEILFITFNDGSSYKYYNVSFEEFSEIRDGNAVCISEGSNKYGSWYVGKSPSIGAAVYIYLVAAGKKYERAAFSSIEELLEFVTDEELLELINGSINE